MITYAGFVAAAWFWLWLRDRTGIIGPSAAGPDGLLLSMAWGIAAALGVSGALWSLERYSPPVARLQARLAEFIGPLSETQITVLALASAIGEEFMFRLAMQDAFGLWPTAVLFGVLHTGPKGTRLWSALALVIGILFGWMIELGCGLLSVTVAHAVINYLSLRRMQKS